MSSVPFISVIVPVYNMPDTLPACLEALLRQTYPRDRYEILVVDNGSQPPCAVPDGVGLLHEAQPGSYAARNRGVSAARGDLLAFTDADCLPAPDWLHEGVAALLSTSGEMIVGGRIECVFDHPRGPSAVEAFDAFRAYDQKRFTEELSFAATANAFMAKAVWQKLGGFDAALKSCGDLDFGQRAQAAGHRITYAEKAVVRHGARNSLRALASWSRRVTGGRYELARRGRPPLRRAWRVRARTLGAWLLRQGDWRRQLALCALLVFGALIGGRESLRLRLGVKAQRE